ncbi:hypothetical protein ACJJTC_018069 [Scirpophaga incertulas]
MAKSCNACEKPIQNTDYMICVKCKKFYDLLYWKTIQSHRDKWLCPLCTNSRPKSDNTSTPVRPPVSSPVEDSSDKRNVNSARGSGPKTKHISPEINVSLADVFNELKKLREEIKEISTLRSELADVRTQVLAISTTMNETLIDVKKKLDDAHREIATLKCTVFQAQKDIEYQEQSALNNELEIIGIPEDKEEDLLTIISTTSKHLGVHLEVTDVNWVSRVSSVNTSKLKNISEKRPRPIIVKLVRRLKRDEIIRASKLKRDFSTDGIVAGPCQPVFINERLTKKNRLLFREARIRTKRNNFKFCWYRNGFIYCRQKENEPAIRILSIEDLEKIGPEEVSCESA